MIKNIAIIEEKLGIEKGKLAEMVTSEEEHEVNLDEIVIRAKADEETFIENLKKQTGKASKEIAVKEFVKEIKETHGLEFEGTKAEKLAEALLKKGEEEAKAEPNQKIVELKKELGEVKGKYNAVVEEKKQIETNFAKKEKDLIIKTSFTKHVPANALVSPETIFTEFKTQGYSIEDEEGTLVIKKDGKIIEDDKLSPVALKDFVSTFVTPFVPKEDGGAGGGDDTSKGAGGKAGSLEAFEKEAEKENWSMEKKNEIMAQRIAEKTLTI